MNRVLSGRGLVKTYEKGGLPLEVLRGLDFDLQEGDFVSIMGASGTGKSTLLHLLGALDHPTEGKVWIDGEEVDFSDDVRTSGLRNTRVGFVFQFHQLLPEFTAVENVALPAMVLGSPLSAARKRASALLTDLGLHDRLTHTPQELSGGEQQRVAVARALVNEPGILLLDEPTGNLDRATGEGLFELLLEIRQKRSLSVVMVTHNEELAIRAEHTYLLEDGRLRPAEQHRDDHPGRIL
jgi:lipoprotein-releasing system ATP-binding protein